MVVVKGGLRIIALIFEMMRQMWVVMLEGKDLDEHFLTKLGKF
jgi:hypothetical protein